MKPVLLEELSWLDVEQYLEEENLILLPIALLSNMGHIFP